MPPKWQIKELLKYPHGHTIGSASGRVRIYLDVRLGIDKWEEISLRITICIPSSYYNIIALDSQSEQWRMSTIMALLYTHHPPLGFKYTSNSIIRLLVRCVQPTWSHPKVNWFHIPFYYIFHSTSNLVFDISPPATWMTTVQDRGPPKSPNLRFAYLLSDFSFWTFPFGSKRSRYSSDVKPLYWPLPPPTPPPFVCPPPLRWWWCKWWLLLWLLWCDSSLSSRDIAAKEQGPHNEYTHAQKGVVQILLPQQSNYHRHYYPMDLGSIFLYTALKRL